MISFGYYTLILNNCIHNFEKNKNSMQLQDNLSRIDRENSVSDKPFDIANKFSY